MQANMDAAARWRLVARYGEGALACQLPYLAGHSFTPPSGDGFVVYGVALRTWVVAGIPVAHDAVRLAQRVVAAARAQDAQVAFFGVDASFAAAANLKWWPCAEEPYWWAGSWAAPKRRPGPLSQVRRAHKAGVRCEALAPGPVAEEVHHLVQAWQAGQGMPPLGFVARTALRNEAPAALRLLARHRGAAVGLVVALPARRGGTWLVELAARTIQAPNGTVELMVDAAMAAIAAQDPAAKVSLGMVALAGGVAWPLRLVRRLAASCYPFAGLDAFRRRLAPDGRVALGLAVPKRQGALRAFSALLSLFARNNVGAYALEALRQGARPVLLAMVACLVPWTLALALAPPGYFAHALSQRAWVAFDVALGWMLWRLVQRPRHVLARRLALAVAADAALTALEAVLAPWPAGAAGVHLSLRIVAVAAPTLAARVLFGAARRLARVEGAR